MKRNFAQSVFSLFVPAFVSTFLISGCSQEPPAAPQAQASRAIPVATLTINPQTVQGAIRSLGVLESAEAVTVNVDFAAPVKQVHVREGQSVNVGDKLLSFDTSKLSLQREQTLQNIAQAKSQAENQQATLRRMQVLAEQQSVSQQELDQANFSYQGLLAKVKQLEAKLSLIDKDLQKATVISPLDAVVGQRLVEKGEATSAMQPLFTLEASNSMKFVCYVSEAALPLIKEGAKAQVTTVTGQYDTAVYSIGAKADPNTGNFEIKLLLDNDQGQLRPGMTGRAALDTIAVADQIVLPETAVAAFDGEHVVYVVEGSTVRRQPVKVYLGFDDQLFVSQGLQAGQVVANSQVHLLTDGSEVAVLP
jgi:membrane fusion protein (multidrug efflux system)